MSKANKLPVMADNFSEWYHEVITQGKLVDASPTRGCVVLRPYSFAIWENIQAGLDKRFKKVGVENAYFPLLIPESFLKKEADHVEGFSPELAVVTHAGGKKLEEPYVVRPTSETIIYHMFSRWISSWRDLPMKINQWANVVRWEMRTRPFLRTTEFLWQEGHTAHATHEEADTTAQKMLSLYADFIENDLCIPLFIGRKTAKERFAGAQETYCMEAMMPDGKALQIGTSHLLAHKFPAAYGVQFQDKDGELRSPWCTSWGTTTRMIGALVMVHGDDNGLCLPPAVAPYQVVIVPIYRKDEERDVVLAAAKKHAASLEDMGIRVHIDTRDERPGAKFYSWELRGAPIRIELGPRDVASDSMMIATRVALPGRERKVAVNATEMPAAITDLMTEIPQQMRENARYMYADLERTQTKLSEFGPGMAKSNGYVRTAWCQSAACEEQLEQYKAGIRCILDDAVADSTHCFSCDTAGSARVLIAKGY